MPSITMLLTTELIINFLFDASIVGAILSGDFLTIMIALAKYVNFDDTYKGSVIAFCLAWASFIGIDCLGNTKLDVLWCSIQDARGDESKMKYKPLKRRSVEWSTNVPQTENTNRVLKILKMIQGAKLSPPFDDIRFTCPPERNAAVVDPPPVAAKRIANIPPVPSTPPSPSPKKTAPILEETALASARKRKNADFQTLVAGPSSPTPPEVIGTKKRKIVLDEKDIEADNIARVDDRAIERDREKEKYAQEVQMSREKAMADMAIFTATERRLELERDLERPRMEIQKELELRRLENEVRRLETEAVARAQQTCF